MMTRSLELLGSAQVRAVLAAVAVALVLARPTTVSAQVPPTACMTPLQGCHFQEYPLPRLWWPGLNAIGVSLDESTFTPWGNCGNKAETGAAGPYHCDMRLTPTQWGAIFRHMADTWDAEAHRLGFDLLRDTSRGGIHARADNLYYRFNDPGASGKSETYAVFRTYESPTCGLIGSYRIVLAHLWANKIWGYIQERCHLNIQYRHRSPHAMWLHEIGHSIGFSGDTWGSATDTIMCDINAVLQSGCGSLKANDINAFNCLYGWIYPCFY